MSRFGPSGRAVSRSLVHRRSVDGVLSAQRPEDQFVGCRLSVPRSGTAAPAPSKSSAAASPPASVQPEWKTFTTSDGELMLDYPPDWTIRDRAAEAAPGGVFVEVLNGAKKSMASLRTNIVLGAQCTKEKYPYSLMDSQTCRRWHGVARRRDLSLKAGPNPGRDPSKPDPLGLRDLLPSLCPPGAAPARFSNSSSGRRGWHRLAVSMILSTRRPAMRRIRAARRPHGDG